MYADSLISCSVTCTINKATRITTSTETFMEHIYTNNQSKKYLSGITLSAALSDHLGTFIAIPAKKLDKPNVGDGRLLIRDMSKFNADNFLEDLNAALEVVNFNERSSVNETFEKFLAVFTETANEHAPMKRASRTEKRIRSKLWLSSSLLKSIRKKKQLFKRYLKTKDKLAHAEYKSYRNALDQDAKQMHYRDLLKENQGNCDKIWKIVNELANIKTKSRTNRNELITEDGKILASSDEIAEGLNEHFANIGPKMAELISPVNNSIRLSCDKSCKNSF